MEGNKQKQVAFQLPPVFVFLSLNSHENNVFLKLNTGFFMKGTLLPKRH